MGTQEAGGSKDRWPLVPEAAGLPQGGKSAGVAAWDGRKIAAARVSLSARASGSLMRSDLSEFLRWVISPCGGYGQYQYE